MSRSDQPVFIEQELRGSRGVAVQVGYSVFTFRADEFVFSPGDLTGRGLARRWPRSAVRAFYAESVGSRTSSLPRGRLLMSLNDGSGPVELVAAARMSHLVVLAKKLDDLLHGIRMPREVRSSPDDDLLGFDNKPQVKTERGDDATVVTVRLNPELGTGFFRFEMTAAALSLSARRRRNSKPREMTWRRDDVVDVTIAERSYGRGGTWYHLTMHLANSGHSNSAVDDSSDAQLYPVLVALRGALELPSRAEAARRWIGRRTSSRPGDATSSGDVLPYAPEPQDKPWLERTPGLFRAFFPREKPGDVVYSGPVLLFAAALIFFASMAAACGLTPTVRTAPAGVVALCALIVSAANVMPVVRRCLQYRTIEVGEDARLVLSVRSPFQDTRQTWDVEEIREVILYSGHPRRVEVRLAKRKVELAGFRRRADAEAFADTLSHALGFVAKPNRR